MRTNPFYDIWLFPDWGDRFPILASALALPDGCNFLGARHHEHLPRLPQLAGRSGPAYPT